MTRVQREKDYLRRQAIKGETPQHGKVTIIKHGNSVSAKGQPSYFIESSYPRTWQSIRKYVRTRDGYICQVCKKSNLKLHIHHINYDKGNCILSNLIALCVACHKKTNRNRQAWYRHLYELIRHLYPDYK